MVLFIVNVMVMFMVNVYDDLVTVLVMIITRESDCDGDGDCVVNRIVTVVVMVMVTVVNRIITVVVMVTVL